MTEEDKELVLKDLCARLLYGVIVHCTWAYFQEGSGEDDGILEDIDVAKKQIRFKRKDCSTNIPLNRIDGTVLPYLRPMSSMTEEECKEFFIQREKIVEYGGHEIILDLDSSDWLNAHHFDYRGLIEKGLAIEAPEGMYNLN